MDVTCGDMSECDETKTEANMAKHGVSFENAVTAFSDPWGLVIDDPDHSETEDRFVLLGLDAMATTLVVYHCFREGTRIRLISARRATRREDHQYWG